MMAEVLMTGEDIKQFGEWRISRGAERRDKTRTRTWVAVKGPVAIVEENWPDLKERIQARTN
jgi:hypothetical protein